MIKLKQIILENEVGKEEDLGKPHVLSETGYEFLRSKIEELNKKAAKWNVPPMVLKILKEEFVKQTITVNAVTGRLVAPDDPSGTSREVIVKKYEVIIEGEPPQVEGYTFIAKIEHTPEGNILNYAPKASSQNLPIEYRTARQACDVCKTTRDRNNTFILRLENDDPQRFPNKKAGEYIMVGSGCLRRFLPNVSASTLIEYAEMMEALRTAVSGAGEMEDDVMRGGGGRGNWMEASSLALWLAATYLHTGKYLSKKKAMEFSTASTLDTALQAMYPPRSEEDNDIHTRMHSDEGFRKKAEDLSKEFLEWAKTKDFDTLMQQKPEYADFFHNLKVISKQEMFKFQNTGFFSALFQVFLRDKGELEKKAAAQKTSMSLSYFGRVAEKINVRVRVIKIKEYESEWGRGLIVIMEAEGTEADPATGHPVSKKGNLLYFTKDFALAEGEEGEITATVKSHQPNKFTQIPETVVTRAKVTKFITHPEKNSGKEKIKDLTCVGIITDIQEVSDYNTPDNKAYSLTFRADKEKHPELANAYGVNFVYSIPDEATYKSLWPYRNRTVEVQMSLVRASTLEKIKLEYSVPVKSFSVIKVIG